MAFRRILTALGKNGPSVETVVETPEVRPGGMLRCAVTAVGGAADADIERIGLELVVRAEDHEFDRAAWKHPYTVATADFDGFRLAAGETVTRHVEMQVPWEMPLTHGRGEAIPGGRAAVRTRLAVDKAVDQGDFDEIQVHALPAQDAILQAYADLGFRMHEAEVKIGLLKQAPNMRARQTAKYWQEIDLYFPESSEWARHELETVFIAREDSLDAHPGGNPPARFVYADLDQAAWTESLDRHLKRLYIV
ncbi:sporulation protein [Streptomyces sp. NPDC048603]|uniref:sporulation protein n=1 Tax=Streptomyces sp. NPDC048603 TaxID=3365577 RepID=UPI00371DBB48